MEFLLLLDLQRFCEFLAADVNIMNHFPHFQQFSVTDEGADGYLGPVQSNAKVHNQQEPTGQ